MKTLYTFLSIFALSMFLVGCAADDSELGVGDEPEAEVLDADPGTGEDLGDEEPGEMEIGGDESLDVDPGAGEDLGDEEAAETDTGDEE